MKRATDFERNHALRAALLAPLAGAPDGIGVAGDHRLVGGIDVRGDGDARLLRCLFTRGLDVLRRETEHRGHHARALLPCFLHELATPPHELRGLR